MTKSVAAFVLTALLCGACAGAATTGSAPGDGTPTPIVPPTPTPTPNPTTTLPPDVPGSGGTEVGVRDQQAVAELADARARWEAAGLSEYRYELTRLCFCPRELIGPFVVTVADGRVVDVVDAESSEPPPAQLEAPTVDGLHDEIAGLLEQGARVRGGSYDEQGLPRQLEVDVLPNAIDDEVTFTAQLLDGLTGQ